jgi:hypothetical protein
MEFIPYAKRRARRLADQSYSGHSGLCADGEVVRVPLTMMDRQMQDALRERFPPQPQTDLDDKRRKLVQRDPFGSESGTIEEEDNHQTIGDGYVTDALALHRPGFRYFGDRSASEQAYGEYVSWLQDAWKRKDSVGTETLPPFGAQPLGAQVEGSSCAVDGRRGVWKREGDYLYCRPVDKKLGDAEPGTREYVDQVWRQMVLDQQNAWKTP